MITNKSNDSLQNAITGMGTALDKQYHTKFVSGFGLDKSEIDAMYREDWIAAKAVDLVAKDMTREWRTITGLDDDQLTKLEAEEKRLGVYKKVLSALKWSRLYGGAAIIARVDNTGDTHEQLDIKRIGVGSLKYFNVMDRWQISAGLIDYDPMSKNFGLPDRYNVYGTQVHASRIVRFEGVELPHELKTYADFWGDSILVRMRQSIANAGTVYQSIASMLHESNIDVVKIQGLMHLVCDDDGANQIFKRLQLVNLSKSIHNMFLIDSEEDYDKKQNSFSGIQPLIYDYIAAVAGAADIPLTRFLGVSPGGLNATGDSDLENYYNRIRTEQEDILRPILDQIDSMIFMSLFGYIPDYEYQFNPLDNVSEEKKAAIEAQKMAMHISSSSLVPDEAIFERIKLDGIYNLEGYDYGDIGAQGEGESEGVDITAESSGESL